MLSGDAVLGMIRLDAGLVCDPFVVCDQLWRETIRQISWDVVEHSGSELADEHGIFLVCKDDLIM